MRLFFLIYTGNIPVFLLILVMSVAFLCLFDRLTRNYKWNGLVMCAGLFAYLGIIAYETIINRRFNATRGFSLMPFDTYFKATVVNPEFIREAIMNVAFFVPLGAVLSCIDDKKNVRSRFIIVAFSAFISVIIEVSQYVFMMGFAEIDDVIHNTIGAAAGILLYVIFNWIFSKIKKPS